MSSSPNDSSSRLLTRLRADQSERWHNGERVPVERYVEAYPKLAADTNAVLDLILAEAMLRGESGDEPSLGDYVGRFPSYAEPLRQRWGLIRLLDRNAAGDATESDRATEPGGGAAARPTLPGYEILGELGRGGMGVVFLARQIALGRDVAVKLIRAGAMAGCEELERFRTEAKAVARLKHPAVVAVHDLGEYDGYLFLVMEYQAGGSLAARLKRGPLSVNEAVGLVRDLARGVQSAHEAQVVHRDLKPGNVLLGADGSAKVGDFGLARLLDSEQELTLPGMVMGTPAYMSPEQARGLREVGPASDIWALGAILYECLAGRRAFQGGTRTETLDRVKSASPDPLPPGTPADLEAVCRRCLEKDPARRYASAAAMADDLDRWLGGLPTQARPPGPIRRARRWLQRRRAPVGAAFAGFLGLMSVGVLQLARDPDRPVAAIERRLEQGEEVVLIGERSLPSWSRPRFGDAEPMRSRGGDCLIESPGMSLIELVRDPKTPRFAFRAKVRHMKSGSLGSVGLYVGRSDLALKGRRGQFFLATTFNDVDDEGQRIVNALRKANARLPDQHPLNSVVTWAGFDYANGQDPSPVKFFEKRLFKPSTPAWNELLIEVRPERLSVTFNGKSAESATAERLSRKFGLAWDRDVAAAAPETAGTPCAAGYDPRGGLGLYVYNGLAFFKDVAIEPLKD